MIFGGLIALFLGGKWTVDGAVYLARQFGISEYLISATIIAVGTSLPELLTSVIAALKKQSDLAIGNIIGSNIFNILWILGITSIISPIKIPRFINMDLSFLLFATFLLFLFVSTEENHQLKKWQGFLFLLLYVIYLALLILRG